MTAPETFAPRLGEVIVPRSGKIPDDLPKPAVPYLRLYDQGYYQHKPAAYGHGIVPATKRPTTLAKIEDPKGVFLFTGPRIPYSIISQAIHFFRRILQTKDSEAEVIITQNWDTKEYRLFVPTQFVSRGGVRSLYNPAHIAPGHLVVGTIHSHCDFSARHSGIDEGDARDMDGIHLTIGMLQKEQPDIDAFIAQTKTFFQYEPSVLADITGDEPTTSPAWWDRYVLNRSATDADRPAWADNQTWDKIMGRHRAPQIVSVYNGQTGTMMQASRNTNHTAECLAWNGKKVASELTSDDWYNYLHKKHQNDKPVFDASQMDEQDWEVALEYGWIWVTLRDDGTGRYFQADEVAGAREAIEAYRRKINGTAPRMTQAPAPNDHDEDDEDNGVFDAELAAAYQDYWEDILGADFVDSLYDNGLIDDGDIDAAWDAGDDSLEPNWWHGRMQKKLMAAAEWLETQGFTITVKISRPKNAPLPGQTEAFPLLPGTTTPSTERPTQGSHV